jgi:RNA polymerase sigma-70 factor, ECF subfamily
VVTPEVPAEFGAAVERHRRELLVHCYQMLGSVHDAQDLVQETMTRAWRAYARYDPARASMRTWLYRIATNACLNALKGRARRPLPSGMGQPFDDPDAALVPLEVPWLQPIPDRLLGTEPQDPATIAVERSQLRLALVAALQLLPPRQRAALILRDVVGYPAVDVAEMLQTSVAAVNSALQRARSVLAASQVDPDAIAEPDEVQRAIVDRYVAAFERSDVEGLTRLLARDVVLEMPPMRNWYVGADRYAQFISRVFRLRGTDWRLVPAAANAQPAVAAYVRQRGVYRLHTLQVFTVAQRSIRRTTVFQDLDVFELLDLAPALG